MILKFCYMIFAGYLIISVEGFFVERFLNICRNNRIFLQDLKKKDILIAGICAGVDVLENAEILRELKSIHSLNEDCVCDKNVVTARANAYVDFAIEVAKKLDLFESEEDLQETINFWKYHIRVD